MTSGERPVLGLTAAEQQRVERIDQLAVLGGPAVPELLAAVADPSWTVRRAAVAALAAAGDEATPALCTWLASARTSEREIAAVVDALAAATGDLADDQVAALATHPDPAVVADVAAILGRRGAPRAVPVLVGLLAHPDANVAIAAIEALGHLRDPAALEPLLDVVRARDFFRTFAAMQVLARSLDPRVVAPLAALTSDELFRDEALAALGRTGSPFAVAPLAAALIDPTTASTTVRLAATALAELTERASWAGADALAAVRIRDAVTPVVPRLLAILPAATPAERAAIATVLGASGDPAALPMLAQLLDDPAVRTAAIAAIGVIGRAAPAAVQALLLTGDAQLRVAVLPTIGAAASAPAIRGLLADDEAEVRAAACDALARIGDTAAVPALFARLGDSNLRVVHAATAAIHSLNTPATASLALATLQSPRAGERKQALRILAYLAPGEAMEPVIAAVRDPDPRIAELAVAALGALEDPRADTELAQLARSGSAPVRASVMRAIGHRGGDGALATLRCGLDDDDAWVRYYACQSLGRLQLVVATEALVSRLADAMPHVRIAAIEALARLATPSAWQALTSAARSHDPDEQRAALVGIGATGRPESLPPLLDAATAPDLATRLIALDGLARYAEPAALAHLAAAAAGSEPELRDAAVALLAGHAAPAAEALLIDLATTTAPEHPVHAALSRAPGPHDPRGERRTAAIAARLHVADGVQAMPLAAALARAGLPGATSALFTALVSAPAPARRAAAIALAGLGTGGALAALTRVAHDDPDPEVRRVAAAAIAS